ncbi:hypothetical protein V8C35DRAFT_300031 [Trichoderma chlorosporum]
MWVILGFSAIVAAYLQLAECARMEQKPSNRPYGNSWSKYWAAVARVILVQTVNGGGLADTCAGGHCPILHGAQQYAENSAPDSLLVKAPRLQR